MWALLKKEAFDALEDYEPKGEYKRHITLVTGVAAYPLIKEIAQKCEEKQKGLKADVKKITNNL